MRKFDPEMMVEWAVAIAITIFIVGLATAWILYGLGVLK